MIFNSIKIWNFKSIEYSNELKLKKLNINLGLNNSGKTNLIQALLLMKQTFENQDPILPLTLNGDLVELGEFRDFIFQHDLKREFKIEFIFREELCYKCSICGEYFLRKNLIESHLIDYHNTTEEFDKNIEFEEDVDKNNLISLKYSYFYDSNDNIMRIKEISYKFKGYKEDNESLIFEFRPKSVFIKISTSKGNFEAAGYINHSQEYQSPDHRKIFPQFEALNRVFQEKIKLNELINNSGQYSISLYNTEKPNETIDFEIKMTNFDTFKFDKEKRESLSLFNYYEQIRESMVFTYHYLRDILVTSRYIGPLRKTTSRIYTSIGGNPKSVGVDGRETYEILKRDWSKKNELEDDLNHWLEKMNFGVRLHIKKLESKNIYQIFLEENGVLFNIKDAGFGISQILPILVECLILSKYSFEFQLLNYEGDRCKFYLVNRLLFIIEEPEIHLNPKIQAILGDLFIKTSNESSPFLIETHSANILNRIQRRIVEKKFNHNDIVINFFQKIENRTEITPIYLDETGNYSFWPKGFFEEDYYDTIKMMKNLSKKDNED